MIIIVLAWIITILGIINLSRITLYMIGADWHDVNHHRRKRVIKSRPYRPYISIIVPAHNEESVILRNLSSIYANDYARKEVIVIDDGSSDKTLRRARYFKEKHRLANMHVVHQENRGKAGAINNGIMRAKGSLVMVLDADSALHASALGEVGGYFKDKRVQLAAANIKIIEDGSIFNMMQKFEYLLCYRMKRAQTAFNMEYIIGGIASTFRKSAAKSVNFFDTDTVTEDIDFTLKLIRNDNISKRVIYAPSVIAYTESVQTMSQLIRQRFRWKYGRTQTFIKNKHMFLSRSRKHDWRLTWFQMPFALFSEFTFLLEPLLIGFILYIVIRYQDFGTLLGAYAVMTIYLALNVIAEETETRRSKLRLTALAPLQYPFTFVLTAVEYAASIKTLIHMRQLVRGGGESRWNHVERSGAAVEAVHRAV
ncbi:MAG TPA: glycosyltransferase family 2 protein [Candidatus Saccharimonadia bacterium]